MHHILVVVDVQVDFVSGALGTQEAVAMIPYLVEKIKHHQGPILFTQDTHQQDYLSTIEGQKLPILHCLEGTPGWEIHPKIKPWSDQQKVFKKPTFGSPELATYLSQLHEKKPITLIEVVGICTDICVISNVALIKATLPNVRIVVDAQACAGVTPLSHKRALEAMQMFHIDIHNLK